MENELLQKILTELGGLKSELASFKDEVNQRFDRVDGDIAEIKENLEEVRSCTNSLLEWADDVAEVNKLSLVAKAK